MSTNIPVCTIDGPSGSGKGTIAALVARHFDWHLLDSGAIYRVVGKSALDKAIALDDAAALTDCAVNLDLRFPVSENHEVSVVLEGQDVSLAIRNEEVGKAASTVAAIPSVREALVARQRAFMKAPGLVADGRDMGTVIFQDAAVKIFLSASAEERAERRYKQLKAQGNDVNLPRLLEGIIERDKRDSERAVAPLKPADDAISIDTTGMSIDDVKNRVIEIVEKTIS